MRIVENYLPDAEIVFLDEIWKAGPAIQNTLLTVLNERVFRNGKDEIKVKLKGLISASNELPAENDGHSDSVEALWDRFIMRLVISGVEDEGNFNKMISDDLKPTVDNVKTELKITEEEFNSWDKEIDAIAIPEEIYKVISVIRKKVQEYNNGLEEGKKELYISDRRWRKIIRIIRTSAFLNDRKEVDLMDCFLIKDCIWSDESDIETVSSIVTESIREYGYNFTVDVKGTEKEIIKLNADVKKETEFDSPYEDTINKIYNKDFYRLLGFNNYPQYSWIKISDFKKINTTQQSLPFHDSKGTLHTNYSVYKPATDILVADNNWSTCSVETEKVIRKEVKTKKPNIRLINAFDVEVNQIIAEIDRQILIVESHKKEKLHHLRTNLFVPIQFSVIVEENINNTIQDLQQMKLNVEKIKFYYDRLE
jgi:MoxR-like ATPase